MTGRPEFRDLEDITAAGPNTDIDVSDYPRTAVQIYGTFVATVAVEISLDGSTFAPFGAALTAPGIVEVPIAARRLRLNATAFTSGTIEATASYVIRP